MNFDIFHNVQLELITLLHSIRGPSLDQIMIFLNIFDTMFFYSLVLLGVWYGYNRKLGIELFFLFVVGVVINQDWPYLFHHRPQIRKWKILFQPFHFSSPASGSVTE